MTRIAQSHNRILSSLRKTTFVYIRFHNREIWLAHQKRSWNMIGQFFQPMLHRANRPPIYVFHTQPFRIEKKIDFEILGNWWRIQIPRLRLPLAKLYGISPFPQNTPPLTHKSPTEFWVTDDGFGFHTPDFLWSNFMEYRPFLKMLLLWPKNGLQNFG